MSKRVKLIVSISCAVVFATVFVLATFFDYQISQALADLTEGKYLSDNWFGKVFETFGETPFYFAGAFAAAILTRVSLKFKEGWYKTPLTCIFIILGVFAYTVMTNRVVEYMFEHAHALDSFEKYNALINLGCVIISVGLFTATLFITLKINEKHMYKLLAFAIAIILAMAIAQIFVQIVKVFMGRQRFRMIKVLEYEGCLEQVDFTKWFVINGKRSVSEDLQLLGIAKDGYKSFPSGHTCSWSIIYVFAFIPDFLDIEEKTRVRAKALLLTGATVSTLLLGYSRILVGAHYATDVLFSAGWTFFSVVISMVIAKKIFKKSFKS